MKSLAIGGRPSALGQNNVRLHPMAEGRWLTALLVLCFFCGGLFAQTASDNFTRSACTSLCGVSVSMNTATVAVSSNVVTVAVSNTFVPGEVVTFSGLAVNTWLNNFNVAVASASATQFSFNFYKSNQSATADTAGTVATNGRGLGNNWSQMYDASGDYITIASNKAHAAFGDKFVQALYVGAGVYAANQTVSLQCSDLNSTYGYCGVVVRGGWSETGVDAGHSTPLFTGYRFYADDDNTGKLILSKVVNGTETVISNSVTVPGADPITLTLAVAGTTLTAKYGSTTAYTVTDSAIASGYPGIVLRGDSYSANTNAVSFSASTPVTITLSPSSLPNVALNGSYSQTITASGGASPYTFSKTSGTLPTGLTLASGGGLTGTATVAGTYTFTITATDNNSATGSQAYTVTVFHQYSATASDALSPSDAPIGKTPKLTVNASESLALPQYADDFSTRASGTPNATTHQYDAGLGSGYWGGTNVGTNGPWLARPQWNAYSTPPWAGAGQPGSDSVSTWPKDIAYYAPLNCAPSTSVTRYIDWSMPLNVLWDATHSLKGLGSPDFTDIGSINAFAGQVVYQGTYGADQYAEVTLPNDVVSDSGFQNLFLMLKWQQTVPGACSSNYAYDYVAYYAGSEPCNFASCGKPELTGGSKWHITKVTPQASSTNNAVVSVAIGADSPVAGDTVHFETRHDQFGNQHLMLNIKHASGGWFNEIDVIDNDMPLATGQTGLFLGTHTANKIYFENFKAGTLQDAATPYPDFGSNEFPGAVETFSLNDSATGALVRPGTSVADSTATADSLASSAGRNRLISDGASAIAVASLGLSAEKVWSEATATYADITAVVGSPASPVGDSFTDYDGVNLTSHVAETGQTWSCRDGAMLISADMLLTISSAAPYYAVCYPSWTAASSDYKVSADVLDILHNSYLMARYVAGANHDYDSAYYGGWNAQGYLELKKSVNGIPLSLATVVVALNTGDTISLAVQGSTLTLYVRGVQRIQITDNSLTQPGHAGIVGMDANGTVFDNFKVETITATPAARRMVISTD